MIFRRWDEMLASFDKAIELNPNINDVAWSLRGLALEQIGRYKKALASFDKAIELNPNFWVSWSRRGVVLLELKLFSEALASLDKAIELNPNDGQTWRNRSAVLVILGRYEEALASLDQTIELKPNDAVAWSNRCGILVMFRRFDEALASSDKAIELDPSNAPSWSNRGAALRQIGHYNEALASYNKAIALGYQSSFVFFNRAEALLALNRWDEGSAALDDALEHLAHTGKSETVDTEPIVRNLFNSTNDAAMWRSRITTLIALYDKHQVVSALGQALVRTIPTLMSEMVSDKAVQTWLLVWRERVRDRPEFQIPLRLLNAAVCYLQTKGEPRVLLELLVEERELLKQVLDTKILNKWKASLMSYDQLRTLSFRLKPSVTLQHRFSMLNLPGKSELLKLQAELKGRSPEKTTIPIALNKAMRALVPDLIYIAANAGQSGDRPWLYSETPINPQALHLILHAWVQTQFSQATEQQRRNVLNQLRVEDLRWQDTTLNTAEWSTAPNGTAQLGSDDNFILMPHLLTAALSKPDVALQFGSELLRFRRAPLVPGTRGAEVVSWPPLQYSDKRGCWYWSVVITFTLQTVPFQDFPVVHCDISLRRWVSLPNTYLPRGEETSAYLLTQVPWLEELHHSNSFQVAPVGWEFVPAAEQQEGQPPYRLTWGSNLAPLLNRLNRQHPFPTPQDIIANPASALNLNDSPNTALVYRNGIKPEHGVGPGLGPEDRRLLAEQIAELLAPEWEFVANPLRVKFTSDVPKNPFLPESKEKTTPLSQFQVQRCRAIAHAVGNQLIVEIWYQRSSTRDALIQVVRECLGIPESASFPYKFPDLEFTLDIRTQHLGTLGAELELDPGINGKKEQRRQAISQRGEEVAAKVPSASGVIVAFIELDGKEVFKHQPETDPKDALRRGFALVNRLTQFISTEDKNQKEEKLSHRALNGFLDLLRQLGVQAPPKIVIKKHSLPEPLHYVGLWLIKQNAPTSADGGIKRVPVMVHMASDSAEIKAIALGFDTWLPYPEALMKIAKGEALGVARIEQAIPFIQQKLKGDVLTLGDTLLLCHAQNLRNAWSWLSNGNLTRDLVAFGKEKTQSITHFKGLRIVRVRDSQSHETPEWYAQEEDEHGFAKGIFQMGERVFASTYNKPLQFKNLSVNLSKVSSWTTKKGKTFEPSPDTYFWNPGLVELTVACIQPDDEVLPWAALTHELRHLALHYNEALKLPLPLHLAKQIGDYVLLIDEE
jgi:tetratricopeptide (TPR) repeat protein